MFFIQAAANPCKFHSLKWYEQLKDESMSKMKVAVTSKEQLLMIIEVYLKFECTEHFQIQSSMYVENSMLTINHNRNLKGTLI